MPESFRLCQVLASAGNGGLEKHVRELGQQLTARGHRVLVLGPADFVATLPPGVGGLALPLDGSRHNPLILWQLARAIRRHRFDLAHAHASKAACMLSRIRRWLPCPTVATLHNHKSSITAFRRHDRLIAVSRSLAQGFPAEQCDVIYHGMSEMPEDTRNLRELLALPRELPVLVAVGRLVQAKGFDVLVRAVSGLAVSLVVIGDGPECAELRRLARRCPNPILFTGHRDDARQLLRSADAVIISSRREGFSYVFAEALMAQRPVLSTDVPIPNEVLPAALIVPTDSVTALRGRLVELLADLPGWHERMQPAFLFARHRLSLEAMTDSTLAVYRKALERDSIRPRSPDPVDYSRFGCCW